MGQQNQGMGKAEAYFVAGVVILAGSLSVAKAATEAYANFQSPLMLAPQLETAYTGSELQKRMISARVADYELFCEAKTGKLGLNLQFTRESGIGNVMVRGDTECSTSGMVVGRRHWLVTPGLYAANSYDPSTFMTELTGLFERSRPLIEQANGENPVLAKAFEADYGEMAIKQGLSQVHFQCEDAGDEFEVVADFHAGAQYTKETDVSIKCERDGQAFTVSLLKPSEIKNGPWTKYAQRNGVSPSLANAAYGEYLRWNHSESKF